MSFELAYSILPELKAPVEIKLENTPQITISLSTFDTAYSLTLKRCLLLPDIPDNKYKDLLESPAIASNIGYLKTNNSAHDISKWLLKFNGSN